MKVIAHRGRTGDTPENTAAAFDAASDAGFDFELDAQPCMSGELVVFHDLTLERSTDGRGRVDETPLLELRRLDAGSRFDARFAGQRIPLLEDVLRRHARERRITVEVKADHLPEADLPGLARTLLDVIDRAGAARSVIVASFRAGFIEQVRRLEPAIVRGFVFDGGGALRRQSPARWLVPVRAAHPAVLMPGQDLVDAASLGAWRATGHEVHVWTVNDPAAMQRMIALGVDGVVTDRPFDLARLLQQAGVGSG